MPVFTVTTPVGEAPLRDPAGFWRGRDPELLPCQCGGLPEVVELTKKRRGRRPTYTGDVIVRCSNPDCDWPGSDVFAYYTDAPAKWDRFRLAGEACE